MKVVSLIDNLSFCPSMTDTVFDPGNDSIMKTGCGTEHGLSLYIELDCGARVLFDMGQGSLFSENAEVLGIDLSTVDLAVVSHGHYDHAGGLETFLSINHKAPVYVRPGTFGERFSTKEDSLKQIGVNCPDNRSVCPETARRSISDRLVFCREVERLPYGITLFSNPESAFPEPPGNRMLFGPDGVTPDNFSHEQSMIITEPWISAPDLTRFSVLFGGCAHRGIANILSRAESLASAPVTAVFSGMHIASLFTLPENDGPDRYLHSLAESLLSHECAKYWTMHCTGQEAFLRLAALMPGRIDYLSCGDTVSL